MYNVQVFFSIFEILKLLIKKERKDEDVLYILKYKNEIINLIDMNIEKKVKDIIDEICKNLKVSIPTCYKLFKINFNETPKKYILNRKLNKSCSDLCKSNKSIEEIAKDIGISRKLYLKYFFDYSGYQVEQFRELGKIYAGNS